MTADLKHLHHLVQRSGLSIARSVLAIHAAAFLCGLIGVVGWWLEIPERLMFSAFLATLVIFVAVTNVAWRRIDLQQGVAQLA